MFKGIELCFYTLHIILSCLIFYPVSQKYLNGFQSRAGKISLINSKGYNSIKKEGGVAVLLFCTSSNNAKYLYQVSQKYLKGFEGYCANMVSPTKFSKGHNSIKRERKKILVLRTSSDGA